MPAGRILAKDALPVQLPLTNLMQRCLGISTLLVLTLFLVPGRAAADSVTASSALSWGAATFSGAVAPTPCCGNPSAPVGNAFTEIAILPFTSPMDCDDDVYTWTLATCTTTVGSNTASASAGSSQFSTVATASLGYLSQASIYWDGSIVVGTNGELSISIPFTATISGTDFVDCGPCDYFGSVGAYLYLYPLGSPGSVIGQTSIEDGGNFTASSGASSTGGLLSLSESGLAPGTYQFEIQMNSEVESMSEPSVLLQLGIGLLGLILVKRFRLLRCQVQSTFSSPVA